MILITEVSGPCEAGKAGNGYAATLLVSLVAKSHYRQTARVAKAFLTAGGSKINPKQNLVTSSGSSQMVTEC